MASRHLPIVGSTASSTSFVTARLDGPGSLHLFLDGNGKVTAGNGTLDAPRPNAFSLTQIANCPGSTPTCRKACYVHNLETAQPDVHALYAHNDWTIRKILDGDPGQVRNAWAVTFANWINVNASGGFRWHVSGDVFSAAYARWIRDVCWLSRRVRHWIYTRSFVSEILDPLVEASTLKGGNLAVNLSCDADNYREAAHVAETRANPDGNTLRLCYLTTDGSVPTEWIEAERGDVVFPDYTLRPRQYATLAESPWWQALDASTRSMVCPVDAHGKSDKNRCNTDKHCSRCTS